MIKQLSGKDDAVFYIFARLNSGGTQLVGQEIRNCVYQGTFAELLNNLNEKNSDWRAIFGKATPDKRMRDAELILRFFALLGNSGKYKKPMKKFLNDFMEAHKNPSEQELKDFRSEFETVAKSVHAALGAKPFHVHAGLNAAAFDSVFVAFAKNKNATIKGMKKKWDSLKDDGDFSKLISAATPDEESIKKRLAQASSSLFAKK